MYNRVRKYKERNFMNINDYTKAILGDKKSYQKISEETEDIMKQSQKIKEITKDIQNIYKGMD